MSVASELGLEEGRGFPGWKGGLLEQESNTGAFKGSRAVWSGWSLEFNIDKAGR